MGNYKDFDLDIKVGTKNSQGTKAHSDCFMCGGCINTKHNCGTIGGGGGGAQRPSSQCHTNYKSCIVC